jgi:4-hydroxy-tetrahydrodipicolinate synthase
MDHSTAPASSANATALPDGIVVSCITPSSDDGAIDYGKFQPHIDWLIDEGAAALSPLGSSGEFAAFELDDRKRIFDGVIEVANGRVPVWGGTHHYSTRLTIELSRHAAMAGAQALLIVPPYYMAPTVEQTMNHYRRIADAVDLPIVLYHNIPLTCVDLKTEHLLTLFNEGAIAGVKMSNPEPDRICQLLQSGASGLRIYCGIDVVAFEGLCHGAHGWISGIPSIVPRAAREFYETIAIHRDLASARQQWYWLSRLMRLEFGAFTYKTRGPHWFSVMRAALNLIGPPVGEPQLPVESLEPEYLDQLVDALEHLGYSCSATRQA